MRESLNLRIGKDLQGYLDYLHRNALLNCDCTMPNATKAQVGFGGGRAGSGEGRSLGYINYLNILWYIFRLINNNTSCLSELF